MCGATRGSRQRKSGELDGFAQPRQDERRALSETGKGSPTIEPENNVEPLISREWTPEAILRGALARIASFQARGGKPGAIVILVEPGILPLVSYANVDENLLAAALLRLQMVAQDALYARESLDGIVEERP